MARLKRKNMQPPGGFTYLQKETRLLLKGDSLNELTKRVIEHRKYKGLSPTDFESVQRDIERYICDRLGHRDCKSEGKDDPWVPIDGTKKFITLSMITGFSRAAVEWVKSGREMVSMEEAQRRREICIGCSLNSPVGGCNCSGFYRMIEAALPTERKLGDLHVCHACHCSLQVKVHLPMNVVQESNEGRDLQFPAYCWQLEKNASP